MDNFFCNKHSDNFTREFSKGKSFKFSEWVVDDCYNNDEFVQDWVTHNGILYACNAQETKEEPREGNDWIKVLSAEDVYTFCWKRFDNSNE